jgi:thiosulfate dehydrogenase
MRIRPPVRSVTCRSRPNSLLARSSLLRTSLSRRLLSGTLLCAGMFATASALAQTAPGTGAAPQTAAAPVTVPAPASVPDVATLPEDAYGTMVRYGKELTERSFAHIGPEVKNPKMRFAGNNLSCTSCHQGLATKPFAMPWVGVHASFPQYRAREDALSSVEERVNGCMERSMAGRALPLDSREMKAYVAFIHFLSRGVPTGARVEGQGVMPLKAPDRRADLQAGKAIYAEKCASCHQPDGQGVRAGPPGSAAGYTFPPLWGKDSFNNGAGMNRLLTAAAFIRSNMPLGATHAQPQLTDAQAYDVAAFVLSQPRPVKAGLERDFPARWNKPVDAAFPPYVDGAPADQHKYGPFAPLQENMKRLKDKLAAESKAARPAAAATAARSGANATTDATQGATPGGTKAARQVEPQDRK